MKRRVRTPAEPKHGWWWGTGRRKRAVARVRIRPNAGGNGEVKVQVGGDKYKPVDQYFAEERDRNDAYAPLRVTSTLGKMDVIVRLSGGGFMGQAQALRLGIARALRDFDPTTEDALRNAGFLTRDAREVERKKYGQAGARRRFQFSKR
ncbi:MAG: 30S ribosomal protein S9 [Phycisphaeraceae bacterium]|nr:30S ribosomal protein S9 [Phycisphaeraceae bacterium]MBX3407308.1 30S ribosomal protein S9 [Phycisphaeraceae bacterium]